MRYYTGDTIHINFVSVSGLTNSPVTASTTFNDILIKDGEVYDGVSATISLIDSPSGVYLASFIPIEFGNYQLYIKNDFTDVIFVTEILRVIPNDQTTIYVGI